MNHTDADSINSYVCAYRCLTSFLLPFCLSESHALCSIFIFSLAIIHLLFYPATHRLSIINLSFYHSISHTHYKCRKWSSYAGLKKTVLSTSWLRRVEGSVLERYLPITQRTCYIQYQYRYIQYNLDHHPHRLRPPLYARNTICLDAFSATLVRIHQTNENSQRHLAAP